MSPNATDLDGKQILTLHNTTSLYHTAFYSVGVGSSDGVFIVFWMVYREMDVIHVRHRNGKIKQFALIIFAAGFDQL